MCSNSVSTYWAILQFQYHSCEEIVYFSWDFSTTFIQYIQYTEVTATQLMSYRCFHCARLESLCWNSASTYWALLQFQYHIWEEIVYFSRDCRTTFIQYIQHTEVNENSWSHKDAFIVQDLNRCAEIQYPLMRHIFIVSTTAVKR